MFDRNSILSVVMRVAGGGFGFILVILIGNALGVSGSGEFYTFVTVLSSITILYRFGIDNVLMKLVSSIENKFHRSVLFQSNYKIIIISVIVLILISSIALFVIEDLYEKESLKLISFVGFGSVFWSLLLVNCVILRGKGYNAISGFIEIGIVPMIVSSMLILEIGVTVYEVLSIYISAITFSYFISLVLLIYVDKDISSEKYYFEKSFFSLDYLIIDFCNFSLIWLPLLVLGFLELSGEAGLYNTATRIALLTNFVVIAINGLAARKISYYSSKKDLDGVVYEYERLTSISICMCAPMFYISFYYGEEILKIVGNEFTDAYYILVVIMIGQVVNVITGPVGYLLAMTGNEKTYKLITYESLIICVVLGILFIPYYEGIGAAVVAMINVTYFNFRAWIWARKNMGVTLIPKLNILELGLAYKKE